MIEIDPSWRAAHPLPVLDGGTDKKSRGRVLAIGGARLTPGAIRLTAEAALRAGAGRVRVATIESAALLMGVTFPEIGVLSLPETDGQIALTDPAALSDQAAAHHAVVLGSGMADQAAASRLIAALAAAPGEDTALVLDAAAVACARPLRDDLAGYRGRLVLTPHDGEMASLTGRSLDDIHGDPAGSAQEAEARFGAVVVLKGAQTVVADPDGTLLHFTGGGHGLATGGSGDVLAGIIGGLLARGTPPLAAAGWSVWLHGEAGRVLAGRLAPLGFLARELLPEIAPLLPR